MKIHSWILLGTILFIPTHLLAAFEDPLIGQTYYWTQYLAETIACPSSCNAVVTPHGMLAAYGLVSVTPFMNIIECVCAPEQVVSAVVTAASRTSTGLTIGQGMTLGAAGGIFVDIVAICIQQSRHFNWITRKIYDHPVVLPVAMTVIGGLMAAHSGIGT